MSPSSAGSTWYKKIKNTYIIWLNKSLFHYELCKRTHPQSHKVETRMKTTVPVVHDLAPFILIPTEIIIWIVKGNKSSCGRQVNTRWEISG